MTVILSRERERFEIETGDKGDVKNEAELE